MSKKKKDKSALLASSSKDRASASKTAMSKENLTASPQVLNKLSATKDKDRPSSSTGQKTIKGKKKDKRDEVDDIILRNSDRKETFRLSGKISKGLKQHQKDGLSWLWNLHCSDNNGGGLLADETGLGKTKQITSYLAGLRESGLLKKVLIIVPPTLLQDWTLEIAEVDTLRASHSSNKIDPKIFYGIDDALKDVIEDNGVLLTTYDVAMLNITPLNIEWDYMIVDEGHLLKNNKTSRYKKLQKISALHRILITATPLQNNLKEFWNVIQFCCPHVLSNYDEFKKMYERPIVLGNQKDATRKQKSASKKATKSMLRELRPYYLCRTKKDTLVGPDELPPKDEFVVWLKLDASQRAVYTDFLSRFLAKKNSGFFILNAVEILQQISEHLFLLDTTGSAIPLKRLIKKATRNIQIDENGPSSKLQFINSLLDDLIPKNHRVLIFSRRTKMLDLIQESIQLRYDDYVRIDGSMTESKKDQQIKKFKLPDGPKIFLLSTQDGGIGLNLTEADRVSLVEPSWNPSTDIQAIDRVHRIRQEKPVVVYRLVTCSTIEECMLQRQIYKTGLAQSTKSSDDKNPPFNIDELQELFKLSQKGFDHCDTVTKFSKKIKGDDLFQKLHPQLEGLEEVHGFSNCKVLFDQSQ